MKMIAANSVKTHPIRPMCWHWVLGVCETCGTAEQSPVRDNMGEDCNLFEKVQRWKDHYNESKPKCACGKPLFVAYRHASVDNPAWHHYAELNS